MSVCDGIVWLMRLHQHGRVERVSVGTQVMEWGSLGDSLIAALLANKSSAHRPRSFIRFNVSKAPFSRLHWRYPHTRMSWSSISGRESWQILAKLHQPKRCRLACEQNQFASVACVNVKRYSQQATAAANSNVYVIVSYDPEKAQQAVPRVTRLATREIRIGKDVVVCYFLFVSFITRRPARTHARSPAHPPA